MDFWSRLFDPAGFVPRAQCGAWTPGLIRLHNISDFLIWAAYLTIPLALIIFSQKRRHGLPFRSLFWLFSLFIVACSCTHFMDIVLFYDPLYRLSGLFKAVTAAASWATVAALVKVMPQAMAMQSPLILAQEIEERKRVESELRESQAQLRISEERFRALTEKSSDVITVLAPEGTILYESPSAAVVLGYPPDELVGTNGGDLVHPDDLPEILRALEPLIAGSEIPDPLLYRYKHQSGHWHWLESMVSNQRENPAIGGFVFNSRDVTDRKRLEQQVIHSEKLAALGELVAGVAHEINNPISAISGLAQLLKMHPEPAIQDDAKIIDAMAARAARIVRSLRSYARLNSDDQRQPAALNDVVHSALDVISHTLHQADITLELALADNLPPLLMNAGSIEQVVVNLLMNAEQALRARPVDQRQIRITSRRETENSGGSGRVRELCVLDLFDSGTGIPKEVQARIFDPFFTTKDIGEGTGLGLYISHGIITAHGGTVEVESREDEGTTFTICLPVSLPSEHAAPPPTNP